MVKKHPTKNPEKAAKNRAQAAGGTRAGRASKGARLQRKQLDAFMRDWRREEERPTRHKATAAELRHRKFVRERTKVLLKRLDQFEAWMDAFEKRYSTNAMLGRLQAIGNRVTYFENHSRMKDFSSLFIRLGQLEASMKTVMQFTQEEVGVLRRIVVASVREPYDVRRLLPPTS